MATEVLGIVFEVASQIYAIVEEVKANKSRSKRLAVRIKCLVSPMKAARKLDKHDQRKYDEALTQLARCLRKAKEFISEFKTTNFIIKILTRGDIKETFDELNTSLDRFVPALSLGLEATMKAKIDAMFEKQQQLIEDREDEESDRQYMIQLLEDILEGQDKIQDSVDAGFENQSKLNEEMLHILKELKNQTDHGNIICQPVEDLKIIESSELKFRKKIDEDKYCALYTAVYNKYIVAVKKFKEIPGGQLANNIRREAEKMKKFDAQNVVRLFGICTENDCHLLIMEYMSERDLRKVLDNHKRYQLTWRLRLRMAIEGASGLFRIHNAKPPMLHRCISSTKFLVNEDLHVKISDCGFALTKSSARRHDSSTKKTTIKYIAPEHLENMHTEYTEKSEVYSFGIVMWEIATLKKPFDGLTDHEVRQYVLDDEKMEPVTSDCPEGFSEIIDRCRSSDPLMRPHFGEIVDLLTPLTRHTAKCTEV